MVSIACAEYAEYWSIMVDGSPFTYDAGASAWQRRLGVLIYYKVADIQAAFQTLSSRGVQFEGKPHLITRMPDHDLWMGFFRDSEGNMLALMSEVPRE